MFRRNGNSHRSEMSNQICAEGRGRGATNITTRRPGKVKTTAMAADHLEGYDIGNESSLFIDSILSRDETRDIVSMLASADELPGGSGLPSFFTSTQMGGRTPRRPRSPPLSPLMAVDTWDIDCKLRDSMDTRGDTSDQENTIVSQEAQVKDKNKRNLSEGFDSKGGKTEQNDSDGEAGMEPKTIEARGPPGVPTDLVNSDPMTPKPGAVLVSDPKQGEAGEVRDEGIRGGIDEVFHDVNTDEKVNREGGGGVDEDGESSVAEGSGEGEEGADNEATKSTEAAIGDNSPVRQSQLRAMEDFLGKLDRRSVGVDTRIHELVTSLEFSQHEIDTLKKENAELKVKMGQLEMEDRRTQYQMGTVEDKIDRLETNMKKKNLILEGLPEVEGKKENVEKVVSALFDQLGVNRQVNFEACFRMGHYIRGKMRPVHVGFERQADRDLVYSKRFELRHTTDFQRVWINEDLGQASKRKRGLIRMIAKQAQEQGIDCRTGKYSLQVQNVRYDANNLEDLPPQLQPANLKQIQIDEKTLAYQSEMAPFSNFYPCQVVIGRQRFNCSEQAFQFLKAKTLNKHLAATKIYLSRDPRDMKLKGGELGSTEEWDAKQLDIMYICTKRKFEQNPELRELLLKSGDLELVEAKPDRLWGCGATLSSNALRRHDWPGANKHGKILMIVREELRRATKD